jgi:hypothetical protein
MRAALRLSSPDMLGARSSSKRMASAAFHEQPQLVIDKHLSLQSIASNTACATCLRLYCDMS